MCRYVRVCVVYSTNCIISFNINKELLLAVVDYFKDSIGFIQIISYTQT